MGLFWHLGTAVEATWFAQCVVKHSPVTRGLKIETPFAEIQRQPRGCAVEWHDEDDAANVPLQTYTSQNSIEINNIDGLSLNWDKRLSAVHPGSCMDAQLASMSSMQAYLVLGLRIVPNVLTDLYRSNARLGHNQSVCKHEVVNMTYQKHSQCVRNPCAPKRSVCSPRLCQHGHSLQLGRPHTTPGSEVYCFGVFIKTKTSRGEDFCVDIACAWTRA